MREPTMADIANHLSISRQLVSIVLRDMPGASDETRERVRKAAEDLGYRPHQGARMLRQYSRRQVGVSFAPANASESDIVEGIYQAVAGHGLQVVLSAQTRRRTTEQSVDELLGYRCAALIVVGPELDARSLRALAKKVEIPLVAVDQDAGTRTFDVVRSAGDVGIEMIVAHLAALGHRDIAYLDAPAMPPAANRRGGYVRAVGELGREPDVVSVDGHDYTEEAGARGARSLIARSDLPTAVVACNDQVAVGALLQLSRAGLAVPRDVSLTGFDDSRFAALSSVDLTTARQDPHEIAEAAVAAAIRRVDVPAARPKLHIVQPSLVVRGSTGPPRY